MSTEELSRSHSREGSKEPEVICAVCSNFEPQAWRKKYCKNCFHSLEEHTADAEKETVHDKIENEKNAKNKAEEKTETDSKLLKDKLLKDDKNKSNQSSADKSQPPKQDKKTTSIADKFNKKSDGVATDNKSKTTETDKISASDKIKGKIESSNQSNTSKDKTEDKIKTSGTKSKSDTKLETSKATESKADSVKQDEKSKQEADKSKTSGLKSKFESKTQNEEKKESSNDKEKREPETKPGVKQFKVPEPKDSKMKWKDMWGSTLQNRQKQEKEKEREKASASSEDKDKKSDTNAKVTDKTDEKDSGKPSSGNEKKNDSIRGKFESKDSGNLWGAKLKPKSENKTVEKDSDKIKPEDKQLSKEEEKHKVDNKQIKDDKPWNKNIKDKSSQKELESPKPKTDETKSKQMDKKDESKSTDKKEDVKTGNEQKKLWGPKSKFDSNKSNKSEESKVTKTFGVGLKKPETKDSKPPDEDKLKSENDNQKNEKLEGKLKLDIKKAEEANKTDKESGHSDWRKAKYEKLSKTPTTISPGKNNEQKGYSRSKSDTSIKAEEDKKSQDVHNIKTPEVKPQSRFGSSIKSPEVKSQPKDDKIKPAKSPVTPIDVTTSKQVETSDKKDIKSSKDKKDDFSDIDIEVKDDGPSRSSSKLNTDAINKIKEAAKFLLDDDFDDDKYNSIGRKGIGNKAVTSQQATPSLVSSATDRSGLDKRLIQGTTIISNSSLGKNEVESAFNEKFNSETERLRKQLKQMEEKCQELEEENKNLKNGLVENEKHSGRLVKQKQDVENSIKVLQKNLTSIETKCTKLESENAKLIENIKIMKAKCESSTAEDLKAAHMEELNLLRNKLQEGENIVEELREDNENLKQEILDLKNEMEEMYDTFRDQEAEEFREIQREMEMHAKNCRVLSFKLRKYERMNEQLEAEKENYEDKITALQNQISDGDTRSHVRDIEDELRLAKEVSVRLHDELDILEEKKCKLEEENSQITRILEQSDKKQFRLELEVDKLRDQVTELKKTKTAPGTPVSQDDSKARRVLIGRIGQQGSQEQDISQLTRDLYDSMERETDLKDQLEFAQEEVKCLRKKGDELEEENENLSVQLKKMSASKVTKYMENKKSDEPEFTEAEIELQLQLDLNEQELMVAKRKVQDLEKDNEDLLDHCKILKGELCQKDQQLSIPQPPRSPNAYYEDRLKEINLEVDELKWKIIEKDREIEKLSAEVSQSRQSKLRKTRSLETDYHDYFRERKKHLELDLSQNADLRDKVINDERAACSPEQLQYRKQLISCNDSRILENNISPEDRKGTGASPIQTLVFTRSWTEENSNSLNLNVSGDNLEQLEELQSSVNSLQIRISELETENKSLKEKLLPEADAMSGETKEDLMDKILDMEEETEILQADLKKSEEDIKSLQTEVTSLKKKLECKETEFRRKELELLRDLDLAQEKNDVLSNLLDIVKDRADAAESELERIAAEQSRSTSVSSENSRRTISVLSDVSFGSDEVFADGASRESSAPGSPESATRREKRSVIQKDWEGQFRKRVHCLERILAEERQKLAATEKKLALVSTETLSSAMSDDAKLHEREKEILQSDLLETKKHLRIASDQIHGLKERIVNLEDENKKLKNSFWTNQPGSDDDEDGATTPSGSIDTVLSLGTHSGSLDTVLSVGSGDELLDNETETSDKKPNDTEFFRQRVTSLEARLEEANDIWKSKNSATEKEKQELEDELVRLNELCDQLREASNGYQLREEKVLKMNKEYANTIKEKQTVIERKDEIIQEHEDIIKQREDDMQQLLDQISQKDNDIRELNESIRSRDERLKEKDEILQHLNMGSDEQQEEINYLTNEMTDNATQIKAKEEKIKELEERLADYEDKSKESNVQQENERLKRELEDMAFSIGKVHTDNNTLQSEMEKTKQALSEAMVLWNKDRSTLGQELSVTREKITMYESTADKKESQAAQLLRKEAHKYLEMKEKLQHDIRIMKVEHDANIRTLKNEKLKLQDELTITIRQLTTEMSNNDKMASDLERLKNQEEVAYQIQHHEKVLRAEYMAMKVRFETRLENLQKEHTKLLTVLDQMQHEKVLNQEIIKGVQKQMSMMKENYNKNLDKLKEQNDMMECHITELDGARKLAMELQKKVECLKTQLEDQEYERAELVDKITAERTAWELERSNKQSKINQLEERLVMINNAQSRTKDMQSRMEVAWNKERAEQKRLLEEAHGLAMDLQRQLKSRDEDHMQEKRILLDQLKLLRKQLDEEQISHREQLSKQGTKDEQMSDLEKRLRDVQDKAEKEHDSSMKDQADLVRRLGEMRRQHKRDQRRMEDVLSGLTRLRELASLVVASENNTELSDNELEQRLETLETFGDTGGAAAAETRTSVQDIRQRINDVVMKYIKEALKEIYFAAENIARPREISDEERKQLRRYSEGSIIPTPRTRSLSSSELDALKDDFVSDTLNNKELEFLKHKYGPTTSDSPIKYQRSISGTNMKDESDIEIPGIHLGSIADRKQNIMTTVHKEQGLKMKFPDPPPSFLLPRCLNTTRTTVSTSQTVTKHSVETNTVRQIPKSISIDTCLLKSVNLSPQGSSQSGSSQSVRLSPQTITPQSSLSFDSAQCSFQQDLAPIPVTHIVPVKNNLSASAEIVTPKTARKQFFAADIPIESNIHKPWPTRSRSHESVSKREREVIVRAETNLKKDASDSTLVSGDQVDEYINLSAEMDDQIEEPQTTTKETKLDKKKQRKAAKRSVSLDSSAKNTIAKAGVSVMSPAAPSALSPSELFAAVKRKFKPNVKRSSSVSERELHSVRTSDSKSSSIVSKAGSTQEMRNTFEPPLSGLPPKSLFIPPPTPPISAMQRKALPVIPGDSAVCRRSRDDKKNKTKKKQRSKSAERARTGPSFLEQPIVKQDIIPPSQLLGFETSV